MKYFLLLCLLFSSQLVAKTVYILPAGGEGRYFFEPYAFRDEVAKPFFCLREELEKAGYTVKIIGNAVNLTDVSAIISFNETSQSFIENLAAYPKERCFLFIFEPPLVLPNPYEKHLTNVFGKIFVLFDDLVDNTHYFKFYYPQPRWNKIEGILDFSQKKLCTLIANNKFFSPSRSLYNERRQIIFFFAHNREEFDLYGQGWQGWPNWKGVVPGKWEALKKYKFTFCYENMHKQKGYITEKIFDAFIGGSIPIYLGSDNITDYIPKECFIDRRNFSSLEELYQFLKNMDRSTYEEYLESATKYLASSKTYPFTIDHFVQTILNELLD